MRSNFKEWNLDKIEEAFGLKQVWQSDILDELINHPYQLDEMEKNFVTKLQRHFSFGGDDWNEVELENKFISPMIVLSEIADEKCSYFLERELSTTIDEYELLGKVDGMIATGFRSPKKPYFCLNEYKRGTDPDGDPKGQALIAMLVAQKLNNNNAPIFGCFVIGRIWQFMILQGNQYTISRDFSCVDDEAFDIFRILKGLRVQIEKIPINHCENKILITGSNGLLGQKLVSLLVQQADIQLIATSRGANRMDFTEGYEYQEMDITNAKQVAEVIEKTRPDAIIHTAAMTNVDQCEGEKDLCWTMNVKAVEYLIEACEKHQIFLCHLSTDFVFDGQSGPYSEEDNPSPVSFYGWSKYAAEEVVKRSKCPWSIVRTVLVYGITNDMSRSNIILWVKNSLDQQKAIKVVTDQFRTPTLAEDLAMGCYLVVTKRAEGIFHISGKDFLTPYEMAIKTANFFGLDKSLISQVDSSNFTQPAKRPARTGFVLDKAISVLGYNPVSFEEGIGILAEQIKVR